MKLRISAFMLSMVVLFAAAFTLSGTYANKSNAKQTTGSAVVARRSDTGFGSPAKSQGAAASGGPTKIYKKSAPTKKTAVTDKTDTDNTEATEEITPRNYLKSSDLSFLNDEQPDALLAISNVDSSYRGSTVPLSDSERYLIERTVNGEFGSDYIGACLIAQCMRDAIVYGHADSAATVTADMKYYGRNDNITEATRQAVHYVFDEGGVVIPHKILVMYNPSVCGYQPWHESKNFVLEYGGVRFFSY